MTRYTTAVAAGLLFTFTGQPSGARLIAGVAACNLALWVWGRVRPEVSDVQA